MLLLIYNVLFPLLFILYLPVFVTKLVRRGGFTHSFSERFGVFSREKKTALRALARPVWIHAVSVGEVVAACSFVRRWQERDPGQQFVVSTTTTTGHAMAAKKLPAGVALIYCPLDFYPFVRRTLKWVNPRMLVIFEVEIWPNLVSLAARKLPVALVNGRMSDKSANGYARHRWLFQGLFRKFCVFCVQSTADAARVQRVVAGEVPVLVCNTMKFDQVADVAAGDMSERLDAVFGPGERLVWTVGSTHPGEESLAAEAFLAVRREFPAIRMVLVPRHHERTPEVERILREKGLAYRLFSEVHENGDRHPAVDVLLVNTTGELMHFYAVCDIAYVGKSLAGNHGGHNIIEPAIFAKPIIHGPHLENFRLVAEVFKQQNATLEVNLDSDLVDAVRELCGNPDKRQELGRRARAVVTEQRGAIDRTLDELQKRLPPVPAACGPQ